MKLLDEDKIIDLSELFKIFGDSTLINILLDEELCVGDIAEKISATQSAVSHQLRILKSSKLVKYRKVGNTVFYSLDDHHIKEIFEKGREHINEI